MNGVNTETGAAVLGEIMDFYKFQKTQDFSQEMIVLE